MKQFHTLLFVCLTAITLQAKASKTLDGYPTIFSDYEGFYNDWIIENEYFKNTSWLKKGWSTYYHFADNTFRKEPMYIAMGDSIVEEKAYARVIIGEKTLLYRQEDDKVYIRDDGEDKLLIDYSLKEGDVFINPQGIRFVVTNTNTAKYICKYHDNCKYWRHQDCVSFIGNSTPRILYLTSEDGTQKDEWIEGLGSAYWGILPAYMAESQFAYSEQPIKSHVIAADSPAIIEEGPYMWAHYSLNEDNYKLVYFNPEDIDEKIPWSFTFAEDTLCITGVMDLDCSTTCAECIITENVIDVNIFQNNDGLIQTDCMYDRLVNVRIPGFKAGTYMIGLSGQERQEVICNGKKDDYIPFVEEGKQWKVGLFWNGSTQASEVELYRMEGDTIVGSKVCKQWIRQSMNYENRKTEYIGAVYEKDGQVYEFLPERDKAVLLYDFLAPIGEWVEAYDAYEGRMDSCYIYEKDTVIVDGYLQRQTKVWSYPNDDTCAFCETIWTEGIGNGNRPDYNSYSDSGFDLGDYHWLMSCTTANNVLLYQSPVLHEDISQYWQDISEKAYEVGKQKIDFTHVIKTRPTNPTRTAGINLVWGEYDNAVLSVNFEDMDGQYNISIRKDDEDTDRYAAPHETGNLQTIDINLSDYPEGQYTVTVENDDEAYTAHFALPLDSDGVEEMRNGENEKMRNGAVYDITGRRVANSQFSIFNSQSKKRGVYIHKGRKVIVK